MPSPAPAAGRRRPSWTMALIAALALAAYLPTLWNGFVWDDDAMLTRNALIRAADGLRRFWFTRQPADYWPVTSTSLWLEWRLWGPHAAGYHAVNLLLHLAECLLLWRILLRLRVPGAALAAMLFAVHPVNVESVAWIAQRKNLVAMLFYLASIACFLRSGWAEGDGRRLDRWYALSLAAFLLALLSKGSVAPLPLVLLGILAWRRRLRPGDLARVFPFLALAALLAWVNVWFQTHGNGQQIRHADLLQRLLGAGAAVWFYLGKALWPAHLVFVYPQWRVSAAELRWWLPLLAAAAVTAALLAAKRARGLRFAWLYFGVMLAPALGFADVYFMRYSLVADHYQHLALIGVVAWLGAAWAGWRAAPALRLGAAGAVLAAFLVLTWRQVATYRDADTLYQATLRRDPAGWMVYNNLGQLRLEAGRLDEARRDLEEALRLNPDFAEAWLNLGTLEYDRRRFDAAIADAQQALRIQPRYPEAYYNLGTALHALRRNDEAAAAFAAAVQQNPDYAEAENNWGVALAESGSLDDARRHYRRALELDPAYAEAHNNLANALAAAGRTDEAIAEYDRALAAQPDYPEAERNLGLALEHASRWAEAIVHFRRAALLRPGDAVVRNDLGVALAQAGRLDEAIAAWEEAVRLDPGYGSARQNLSRAREMRR
ncbi:MAG TPA: tetratricopeptide repeat protein [Opitutaceae bacterium]|nr:tetratricopeptide repeat protein [Opitutaceae bacterium]